MKSHHPPDIKKVFANKPSAKEIADSFDRARRAQGSQFRNSLESEEDTNLRVAQLKREQLKRKNR